MNSFTAPHNYHTYQVDLFFMGYYDFDEGTTIQRWVSVH